MTGTAPRIVRDVLAETLRVVHPVEARLSPDGSAVAATAAGPDGTTLVLAAVPGDGTGQALHAPDDPSHTVRRLPRWLPDAQTVLHVAEPADGTGPGGLATLDTRTGRTRTVVDRLPGAVEELHLSDDGRTALLLCAPEGAERDGMNLGTPVRFGPAPAPERFTTGSGRRTLHLACLADGSLREAGPAGLTVWNVAWRGGTAVATVGEDPLPAGYYTARFAALDLDARTARTLYTPRGQLAAPAVGADGRFAAVVEGISIVAGRPVVVDLESGATHTVPGIEDATWLHVEDAPGRLLHAGWDGTGSRVGRDARTLWRGEATVHGASFRPELSPSADGRLVATVLEAPGRPAEVVVAATDGPDAWSWVPVTALNRRTALPELSRVVTASCAWRASDGRPVHGLLLSDGARAVSRPLAVLVHGGPSWLWTAAHAPADVLGLAPALAAAGYLVLLPNPRGSSGYGLDHARAVVGDTGGADLDDVLSGVRHLTDTGLADPGRTAILGHSYGGYLAALAAARTDLFRAAVVVSAPTDWFSFSHTSNIGGGYDRTYAIGDPAEPTGLWARSAVAAHGGSGTPTLIVHGSDDRVTPVGQAHELYRALSRAGRAPVELCVYPGEGHEFTDPDHLLDAAARAERWLAAHLMAEASPTTAAPADGASPEPAAGAA
ncbi:alpha/beta hydrolase family protein, partial [Streptomyces longispororuber]|uniref:alpha/beta hydrolase family protein n=1 Tax=Streptomyces longispororuber TaxID=68230 RepID=UPI00210A567F